MPLVRVGGRSIAYKGDAAEELSAAENACRTLRCTVRIPAGRGGVWRAHARRGHQAGRNARPRYPAQGRHARPASRSERRAGIARRLPRPPQGAAGRRSRPENDGVSHPAGGRGFAGIRGGTSMLTKERIVELLGLEPLQVEGGMYKKTYRSDEQIAQSEGRTGPHRLGRARSCICSRGTRFRACTGCRPTRSGTFTWAPRAKPPCCCRTGRAITVRLGQDLERGEAVQAGRAARGVAGHAARGRRGLGAARHDARARL